MQSHIKYDVQNYKNVNSSINELKNRFHSDKLFLLLALFLKKLLTKDVLILIFM
jgi:hypothetical protein